MSSFPHQERSVSRLLSVQALYQMDVGGSGLESTLSTYPILSSDYADSDEEWFCEIITGVHKHQKSLDPILHSALRDDWPLKSLDATLRALLRAGAYELCYCPDIDSNIIINEYIEVAKAFFDGNEPSMANGVLDELARRLRGSSSQSPSNSDE